MSDTDFVPPSFGWVNSPADVAAAVVRIAEFQNIPALLSQAAPDLVSDDDKTVLFWTAEDRVLGRILPSWNQGSVGSCVSFGFGRACQDLMLMEILVGEPEEWPGAEVATEPIYGGSRVEVGGGRIGGDGSVGAWAAEWVTKWGVLLRQKYGSIDLSSYSESRCRQYGNRGCPDELEPVARQHPVRAAAMVTTAEQAWAALGSGYPIPICSDQGFTSTLRDGICEASGSWAHCMALRGRFVHHTGEKVFAVQNSWGGYLRGEQTTKDVHGNLVTLPEGCFCARWSVMDRILRQRDSFALSGFNGFPKRNLDWLI